ncbi:MAG: ATP synthase subunit I [Gammaproteobacteria bacterium]
MDPHAQELVFETRRVIGLQLLISALVAAGFYVGNGPWEALSAAYGGLISVISAVLLSRGVIKAGTAVEPGDKKKSEAILYAGAALRFILVLVCFGIGLAVLKLAPLATVMGFIAVQLAFIFSAKRMKQQQT